MSDFVRKRDKQPIMARDENVDDEQLVLTIDSGLMAWLRALVAGPGFFGGLDATAVYLIRSALVELMTHDVWYGGTVPHLPSPMREANMKSPKYRALEEARKRK